VAALSDPRHAAFLQMIDELHARHLVGIEGVQEVWLIRHADAYTGMETLSDGRVDPPLSARGRDQARRLAARLSAVPLDGVWASDLKRSQETAEEIVRGRVLPVTVDPRLREVRTYWDEGRQEKLDEPGVYPFPEPETEVMGRMTAALADVVAELVQSPRSPARAAVVSHNAAIGIYVSSLLGLSWGQLRVMPQFTSVTVLAVKDEQIVVRSIADATHLTEEEPEMREPDATG
jgi:broad specificity phosphatase PhoE